MASTVFVPTALSGRGREQVAFLGVEQMWESPVGPPFPSLTGSAVGSCLFCISYILAEVHCQMGTTAHGVPWL